MSIVPYTSYFRQDFTAFPFYNRVGLYNRQAELKALIRNFTNFVIQPHIFIQSVSLLTSMATLVQSSPNLDN
jgi:hypothetical protein